MNRPIEIEGLTVSYDRHPVLSNVYLDIDPGRIIGILGPNGAGKSTLFKAILGLVRPDQGDIRVFGRPPGEFTGRLAYVPQKDEVDWTFPATVRDIVMMGRYPGKSVFSVMTRLDRNVADDAMDKLGIRDLAGRQIGALSGGQQQRVFIARALCQEADLLLLDEPFAGVDIVTEEHIVRLLRDLAAEGKTILVVHHDLSTVADYFGQVLLVNRRVIAFGDTGTTFTPANIARAFGAPDKIGLEAGRAR
jgi:ABC-type Mn2+/Zn2+ transport system ATPase subunit